MTSITIPNSMTRIGRHTFTGSGITSIEIPNSVTKIEEYVFDGVNLSTSKQEKFNAEMLKPTEETLQYTPDFTKWQKHDRITKTGKAV